MVKCLWSESGRRDIGSEVKREDLWKTPSIARVASERQSSVLGETFLGRVLFNAVGPHPLIGESLSHRIALDSIAEHEFHSLREVIHCCPYLTAAQKL